MNEVNNIGVLGNTYKSKYGSEAVNAKYNLNTQNSAVQQDEFAGKKAKRKGLVPVLGTAVALIMAGIAAFKNKTKIGGFISKSFGIIKEKAPEVFHKAVNSASKYLKSSESVLKKALNIFKKAK